VKGTVNGSTTSYIGNPSVPSGQVYYEWKTSNTDMNVRSRYYYAGSTRVAMRTGSSTVETQHAASLRKELGDNSLRTGWATMRSPPAAAGLSRKNGRVAVR
jgi:hypothetical protein